MNFRIIKLTVLVTAVFLFAANRTKAQTFKMPEPTGKYKVGTDYFHFIDKNREEIFTEVENDYREVTGQIWYPSQVGENDVRKPYREKNEAVLISTIMAEFFRILVGEVPQNFKAHFSEVKTYSYLKTPIAASPEPFPVLIYSHGIIGGHVNTHTVLMEELASHGYVVLSISHPYQTPFVKYPDGTIKAFSSSGDVIKKTAMEIFNPKHSKRNEEVLTETDLQKQFEQIKEIEERIPFIQKSVDVWSDDIILAIDEVIKINENDPRFKERIDTDKIGVLGWSFGGASSGDACIKDKRIKAGMNIDGMPHGLIIDKKISQPFLFMRNGKRSVAKYFVNQVDNDCYVVKINGTSHFNFTDMPLFNIPEVNKILGPSDGKKTSKLISQYTLEFFNKYLKGKNSKLFQKDTYEDEYLEVTVFNN